MSKIGMQYLVYAPITSYTEGSAITYGSGKKLMKAVRADVSLERSDNDLYADDAVAESDNGLTGYKMTIEGDQLPADALVPVLGEKAVTSSGATVTCYQVKDGASPVVGVGYMRVLKVNNVKSYEGFWYHRVMLSITDNNDKTKPKTVEWGTYTLNGKGLGALIDTSGETAYYDHMPFDTYAEAKAWLNSRANITT